MEEDNIRSPLKIRLKAKMVLNVLTKICLGIIFGVMVIWEIIIWPYTKWKENKKFKRRLKELKERDPFIYK